MALFEQAMTVIFLSIDVISMNMPGIVPFGRCNSLCGVVSDLTLLSLLKGDTSLSRLCRPRISIPSPNSHLYHGFLCSKDLGPTVPWGWHHLPLRNVLHTSEQELSRDARSRVPLSSPSSTPICKCR